MAPSTSSTGAPRGGPRRHRWLRPLAVGVLSLVGLVLVVVAGALTYLATPSGGRMLRELIVEKANGVIEGALAIRAVSLRGPHLVLNDVELRDPDGDIVASISRVEIRLRLAALVRRRIDLALVRLDRPEIHLVQDERGGNLERAVAARNPTPVPEAQGEPSSFGLVVEDVDIADGIIDMVQRSAGGTRNIRLDELVARGSARKLADALGAQLDVTAHVTAPLDAALRLGIEARGAGARKDARIALELGAAKLVATAHTEDEGHAEAQISLVVPPEVARAFSPGYPLRAQATLSAEAKRGGEEVSLHVDAKAASASARLDGAFDPATRRARAATMTVRHVDLSELTDDGPASDVSLTLVASGGGTSLDDAVGRLELSVPPSRMAGETMGPVHVLATAGGGEVWLRDFLVNVPGVRVEARGQAGKERLSLSGRLVANDLAAFGRTLGVLVGPKGLSAKGQGQVDFAVHGPTTSLSVKADGSFPILTYGETRIDRLTLHLDVPNMKSPAGTVAHLAAKTLALAPAKVFRAVHLNVDGEGEEFSVDSAVHGYAELSLQGRASLSPDGHGGTLQALSVRYPEATWILDAPVRIELRPGVLAVSPWALRAGDQVISARALKHRTKLDASLELRSFDLGKLPKAFVDPALGLGGVLNVHVDAKGPSSRPDVTARIDLRGGRFKRFQGVGVHLDAAYAGGVAKGTLAANGEGIRLAGSFDVPVKALERGRHAPVKVELDVPELRLDESLRELGIETPISGLVSAQISLRGTADDPRLAVALQGRRVRVKRLAPLDVDLALQSAEADRLRARVDLALEGKKSFVEVRTPFTLRELLRKPPRGAALTSAEYALEADVRELPLKLLSEAGISSRPLHGALSARVHLSVADMSPRGEASVTAKGLATQGLEPLDMQIQLAAGDELRADARAEQGGKPVLAIQARVRADPKALKDRDRLAQAPLSIEANVGPLPLSGLQAAMQPTDVEPARALPQIRGTLAGQLAVSGTLHDPRALLRMHVDGLGAEDSPEGQVALSFDYAAAKEKLDLSLTSQNRGEVHASATAHVDLSFPTVTRRNRLGASPVDAALTAKDFDPAFLAKLTGAVEKLGGFLYADARVSGTIGSPTVTGRLEWKDGLVFTHGNGDFTGIHLLVSGDNDRVELQELTAKSGRGKAKLSALIEGARGKTFKIHAEADLDKFRVMSEGQVVATLSVRSTADGDASPEGVMLKNLHIPEAHVQLPDVQGKDAQKLDHPPDVVLTVNGKPLRGAKTTSPQGAAIGADAGAGGAGEAGSSPTAGRPATQVAIVVNAPRNLWIQGNDVNAEIGFSEGFRVEYATEPRLFGDVNVIRGRLDVFGRRFDLQQNSHVSFAGPPIRPNLNVTATYKNALEQVTVYLKVQGEADKLELKPTSDPALSETEIYTLLATGHTSLHHGTGASSPSGEAASLVGSLAASQLKKTLSSKLPLDVLSIEAGDSGIAGSKLEAGTYVNDRFYAGFRARIGADPMRGENSNEVDLEYQLSKHWSVNGRYGDARAGGAGVSWQKEY